MKTSDKIEQVSASLFAVHRDLANPTKDAKGQVRGRQDYRYLSLPALIDHLRPYLKEAQLYVTQEVAGGQGFVEVSTTVWHLSGQFIEFGPAFISAAGDAQQQGSAITYARRYALAAVFNLAADEDNDASSAARPSRGAADAPGGPSKEITPTGGPNVEAAPEALGEGANGAASTPLATEAQWMNLLQRTSGKTADAAKLINEKNGTDYTYRSAREGATWAELEKAMA